LQTKERGAVTIYLLWDGDEGGRRRFMWQRKALVDEMGAAGVAVGDELLILRGEDDEWVDQDGETKPKYRFAVRARPCGDPLPGSEATPAEPVQDAAPAAGAVDDDIPF
jgi:hypothetical protein